ncbi:MAG TPA: bifunctional glycosyltransferase family 2/GtrA family protein [Firmicutes bacterium]|nr:bifunctional glycosyltransferase family 2/GtrA family protein [Bacillota bacterium]
MSKIDIIIPAYEPDVRLLNLLEELDKQNLGPVILINDGSGPEYNSIFEKAALIINRLHGTILTHDFNKGKGRALKTAFSYILKYGLDVEAVVTADSDGQHTPECIKKMINATEKNPGCLILGVRNFTGTDVPWKSRFGNRLTEKVFQFVSGAHITDTQTGLRGIPRKYMKELLELKGERFEFEMRMLLDAAGKYQIVEIPISTVYDSVENHQTHFDPFRDSLRIYRILGKKIIKYVFSSFSSSIIDLIVFSILIQVLRKSQPLFYTAIATVIARLISATYNYFINYKVVFKSNESVSASALKYFILAIAQMICSAGLVTVFAFLIPFIPEIILKIVVDTFLFFVSYYIQQHIVFHKQ